MGEVVGEVEGAQELQEQKEQAEEEEPQEQPLWPDHLGGGGRGDGKEVRWWICMD